MGLDITAYKNITLIDTCAMEEWEGKHGWAATVHIWPGNLDGSHFPEQRAGAELKPNGVYEYEDVHSFRAGSYSGYNHWRSDLAMMALGQRPEDVWAIPAAYRDKPFYYIVNFSDCEGYIAGVAAKKLAQDFADFQERADQHPSEWFREKYADWRKAFEFAAENGFVSFH